MTELVGSLKALADQTRWQIIMVLLDHDLCVGSVAKCVGVSESAASQHLKILRSVGLVSGEKRGYWTHYSVDRSVLSGIGQQLMSLSEDRIRGQCPAVGSCSRCDRGEEDKHAGR